MIGKLTGEGGEDDELKKVIEIFFLGSDVAVYRCKCQ